MGSHAASPKLPGSGRSSVTPEEAAALLSSHAVTQQKLSTPRQQPNGCRGRKRHFSQMMVCALCEQEAIFEHSPTSREVVCTCCGAVIEQQDKRHMPFKLPMPMHLHLSADLEGSLLTASKGPTAMDEDGLLARSPILRSCGNAALRSPSSGASTCHTPHARTATCS